MIGLIPLIGTSAGLTTTHIDMFTQFGGSSILSNPEGGCLGAPTYGPSVTAYTTVCQYFCATLGDECDGVHPNMAGRAAIAVAVEAAIAHS